MTNKQKLSETVLISLAFGFLFFGCASLGKENPTTAIVANANKPVVTDGRDSSANIDAIDYAGEDVTPLPSAPQMSTSSELNKTPFGYTIPDQYSSIISEYLKLGYSLPDIEFLHYPYGYKDPLFELRPRTLPEYKLPVVPEYKPPVIPKLIPPAVPKFKPPAVPEPKPPTLSEFIPPSPNKK